MVKDIKKRRDIAEVLYSRDLEFQIHVDPLDPKKHLEDSLEKIGCPVDDDFTVTSIRHY